MTAAEKGQDFELTGGALCLDFANTLGDRPHSTQEHLGGYDHLLGFMRQAGALPPADVRALARLAQDFPRRARTVFKRALALRETLYRIFSRLARSERPARADLESLNSVLRKAMHQLEIREQRGGFEWTWAGSDGALDRPLWPIARSAAELLTSDEVSFLRECASGTCSWLFVDRSRTRRRRWCDMATCGNRAKARRHYQRRKKSRVVR